MDDGTQEKIAAYAKESRRTRGKLEREEHQGQTAPPINLAGREAARARMLPSDCTYQRWSGFASKSRDPSLK
jgi:hypothetical protein